LSATLIKPQPDNQEQKVKRMLCNDKLDKVKFKKQIITAQKLNKNVTYDIID